MSLSTYAFMMSALFLNFVQVGVISLGRYSEKSLITCCGGSSVNRMSAKPRPSLCFASASRPAYLGGKHWLCVWKATAPR